jgi:drug/metabolite transporter (DMT)-like permease
MNRSKRNRAIVGAVMVAVSIVCFGICAILLTYYNKDNSLDRVAGTFCGLGGGLLGSGGSLLVMALWRYSPETERRKEIEQHDERNIQVNRAALSIVAAAAFIMLGILSVLFTLLECDPAGMITSASIFVLLAVYVIAYSRMNKIM